MTKGLRVTYEWDAESVHIDGDVIEHYHEDKLENLKWTSYTVDDDDLSFDWNDKGKHNDWFIWDFTLEELQEMPRVQVKDFHDKKYDGNQTFCTLEEYIDIAKDGGAGIYPEIKHSTATDKILADRGHGKEMVDLILEVSVRILLS